MGGIARRDSAKADVGLGACKPVGKEAHDLCVAVQAMKGGAVLFAVGPVAQDEAGRRDDGAELHETNSDRR